MKRTGSVWVTGAEKVKIKNMRRRGRVSEKVIMTSMAEK